MDFSAILDAFEDALELERELGHRLVECDRSLLAPISSNASSSVSIPATPTSSTLATPTTSTTPTTSLTSPTSTNLPTPTNLPNLPNLPNPSKDIQSPGVPRRPPSAPLADFAFLLECEPAGQVAELLPKMSEAIGYGRDGVKINDPSAKVLIVLGSAALQKWLPGVKALPGQWVKRGDTPALVTASPTKTYRFYANDPAKILALKRRLWADLKAALARIGKTPPNRKA